MTPKFGFSGMLIGFAMIVGGNNAMAMPLSQGFAAVPQAADHLIVLEDVAKKGGAKAGGAKANVNRGGSVNRSANVNRNTNVNRSTNVNRNTNVNVNRSANVNVVRPVRVWAPRPYYGTVVGGVALGTAILVAAAGTAPAAPAPNMCWFWMDTSQMQGYWDYCRAP